MKNDYRPEDEINYGDLLKSPSRLFGAIYPFLAILIIAGGIYWVFSLDWADRSIMKRVELKRDTVAEPILMAMGSVVPGVDVKVISQSTPELIAKGKDLYTTSCSSCHGVNGDGNGVAAKALNPPPRNYMSKDGWKNGQKLSQMWKTIEVGIPGSGMISYNYIPVADRFAIIHYIHSLMGEFPVDSESDLAALDIAYNLSTDKVTSNKIPLELASSAVISDYKSYEDKILRIEELMKTSSDEPGAMLLLNNSKDQRKMILTLLRSDDWKNGQSAFTSVIASSLNNNGFKSSVLRLKNIELNSIHNYLLKTFSLI